MKNTIRAALAVSVLALASCGESGNIVVDKMQAGIAQSCSFLADYKWLADVVSKMDITAATIGAGVTAICNGVTAPPKIGLFGNEKKCMNGEIVVNDETICIEGEKLDP